MDPPTPPSVSARNYPASSRCAENTQGALRGWGGWGWGDRADVTSAEQPCSNLGAGPTPGSPRGLGACISDSFPAGAAGRAPHVQTRGARESSPGPRGGRSSGQEWRQEGKEGLTVVQAGEDQGGPLRGVNLPP